MAQVVAYFSTCSLSLHELLFLDKIETLKHSKAMKGVSALVGDTLMAHK